MRRQYLMLCAITAGWGTIPVLVGRVNMAAPLIVAMRLWTATVCLGAALWLGHRRDGRTGRTPVWPRLLSVQPGRCLLVAAVLAGHWLALFAAYKRAPAGTVILIVYLAPTGVAALAPRFLGERLGWRTVVALAGATAGFGLVAAPTVQAAGLAGLVLSLTAAVLFVALIVLSKPLASVYGGLRLAFLEMGGAGLVLVPVALTSSWPAPQLSWLWLLVLGAVHTALAVAIYLQVLADLPATHVGILGYLEPVGVILCAWLWLGQRPAPPTVGGGLLVVGAGVVTVVFAAGGQVAEGAGVPLPPAERYRRRRDHDPSPVGGRVVGDVGE